MPDVERRLGNRPALSRCISVPVEAFAAENWGRVPLLSRAADLPEPFSDLFSSDAVDELVSARGLRTPFVRMAKEGTVLAPARYTSPGGFGAEVADQLNSEKVLAEFSGGSTLVLQGLHRTWAPLADFTRQLISDVGHPCQVNAYVTPASSRGFDPHYDVHDVFVIQIDGEKRWTIHEPVHPDPLTTQPWTDHRQAVADRAALPPSLDETLRPGDVLYLPRGWLHSATALGGTSVHLTVGIAALTRFDIVEQLTAGSAKATELRRSLPLGLDLSNTEELRSIVETAIDDLTTHLRSASQATDIGDRLARSLREATRPEQLRPLATVDALAALDEWSEVSLRRGLDVRLSSDDETVSIRLPASTVTLPGQATDAVSFLLSGQPARAGALPGLDPASSLVVARRLVREGVVIVR